MFLGFIFVRSKFSFTKSLSRRHACLNDQEYEQRFRFYDFCGGTSVLFNLMFQLKQLFIHILKLCFTSKSILKVNVCIIVL